MVEKVENMVREATTKEWTVRQPLKESGISKAGRVVFPGPSSCALMHKGGKH